MTPDSTWAISFNGFNIPSFSSLCLEAKILKYCDHLGSRSQLFYSMNVLGKVSKTSPTQGRTISSDREWFSFIKITRVGEIDYSFKNRKKVIFTHRLWRYCVKTGLTSVHCTCTYTPCDNFVPQDILDYRAVTASQQKF